MTTVSYTTPGSYTFTVPAGVTVLDVIECQATGGSGGGAAMFDAGGGAGGCRAYKNSLSVTPGNDYTIVVPAAPGAEATNGSDASCTEAFGMSPATVCLAKGGVEGGAMGGTGSTTGCIGDELYRGGSGGAASGGKGGSGGSSAGNHADGTDSPGATTANTSGPTGSGYGGGGGDPAGPSLPQAGQAPGGGGGGGYMGQTSANGGGAGWVKITYTEPGGTYTGTGAVTLPELTLDGAGTFSAPVYTGTGAVTLPELTLDGAGTFGAPVYTGTGEVTLPELTLDGAGTFTEAALDLPGGYGLRASNGAVALLTDCTISGNRRSGVACASARVRLGGSSILSANGGHNARADGLGEIQAPDGLTCVDAGAYGFSARNGGRITLADPLTVSGNGAGDFAAGAERGPENTLAADGSYIGAP